MSESWAEQAGRELAKYPAGALTPELEEKVLSEMRMAEAAWRKANRLPAREPVVRLDKDHGWPEPPAEKFDPLRMFYAARRILMRAARRK